MNAFKSTDPAGPSLGSPKRRPSAPALNARGLRGPAFAALVVFAVLAGIVPLAPQAMGQTPADPTVTAVNPVKGIYLGGTTVTITGTGFVSGASVTFGDASATDVNVLSTTTITAITPAHAGGAVVVSVKDPTTFAGSCSCFTYVMAPEVDAVSPARGAQAGGSQVTITGFAFVTGATVTFGDSAGTGVVVVESTRITATAPAHALGPVDVTVRNPDARSGTLPDSFTYAQAPSLTGIWPNGGLPAGGTSVTIVGTGFEVGATVRLGGVPATDVAVVDATQLTAKTPAHGPATVDLVVTNPDGQATTLPGGYTYRPAPTVTAVSPTSGPSSGGGSLTITGTGFVPGAQVSLDGTPAEGVTVVDGTRITATTPAHPAGAVAVAVRNTDDQVGSLSTAYTYLAGPGVASVSPTGGAPAGGTPITIVGSGFADGATVTVGGAPATNVVVTGPTRMTATTPSHDAGAVDIIVGNPDAQHATLANGFTYRPGPTVTGISPNVGTMRGGTPVTVTGTGFLAGATLTIGGVSGVAVHVDSATSITATMPSHVPGAVDIVVMNTDTQVGELRGGYVYMADPAIEHIAPDGGLPLGGTAVTITGSGFSSGATVKFDGVTATGVTVVSATKITAKAPSHTAGAVNVTVTNPDGQAASLDGAYVYGPAPKITGISPKAGSLEGGDRVTITGSGFRAGASITFGDVPATNVLVVNATSLTARTPAHAAGPADVVVVNPDNQTGTVANGYTFNRPAPLFADLSPDSGAAAGGTFVTITGAGFTPGTTVTFGGIAAPAVTWFSPTMIEATTPPHAAGTVDVVASNPDGQRATLASSFTYAGAQDAGTTLTDDQLLAANKAVILIVTREESGNRLDFILPQDLPAPAMGVQVFRGGNPYRLVATLESSSSDFQNGTYLDSAARGATGDSKYLVTVFYASSQGRATSSPGEIPAFDRLGAGTLGAAAIAPSSKGLAMLGGRGLLVIGGALLLAAAVVAGIVAWRRRISRRDFLVA